MINNIQSKMSVGDTKRDVEKPQSAQYVNCAAANSGADAGMYDASSEIYKLSTIMIQFLFEIELMES